MIIFGGVMIYILAVICWVLWVCVFIGRILGVRK